jgi:hypothetical protein
MDVNIIFTGVNDFLYKNETTFNSNTNLNN